MKHPTCETCIWWEGMVRQGVNNRGPYREEISGECRANPPFPGNAAEAVWPISDASDWCGLHRANWQMYTADEPSTDRDVFDDGA